MSIRKAGTFVLLTVSLGLLSFRAYGQVLYGSLVGTVEDATGGVVAKAAVIIINKQTGLNRETSTDGAGRYSLLNVLPGSYDLRVTAAGFRTLTRADVEIVINTVARVDARLEVGQLSEQVTVAAEAAQLQADKSDVRHEITTRAMTDIPLTGYRNYQTLLNLVPGTTPAEFQNAILDTPARSLTTRVNGTPRNSNNTLTDGAVNMFIAMPHHQAYVQPVESIETVNISTGSFDAEQGMTAGAAVTVVTKSGTNELHGSGFWYHDNQRLLSAPYFRAANFRKPKSIFNQFGGTVGGPIKRDKLFYFVSWERTMQRLGASGNFSVPPPQFRVGDFSRWSGYSLVYDPATSTDPRSRQPFPGNRVPAARIHPTFDAMQRMAPPPNQDSPTDPNNLQGNFGAAGVMRLNRDNYDVKVNWNATRKLVIWGKHSRMDAPVTGKHIFGELVGPSLGTSGIGDVNVNMPASGYTYIFSPTFMTDGVFGYMRHDQELLGPDTGTNYGLDVWRIPGTNGGRQYTADMQYSGLPAISGFGFSNWGLADTWLPAWRKERLYSYATNFSKISGPHELRWGFDMRRLEIDYWNPGSAGGNPRGSIAFAGGSTIIPGMAAREPNSYAAALLGLVGAYSKSIQFMNKICKEWQYAWYFRDRWRASRRLTLNLGLRYEYYPMLNRGERGVERWNPYTNLVYLGGSGDVPRSTGVTVSKKLFAPRFGFAYRIRDNWVVRSGYGITYNPLPFARSLPGGYPWALGGDWGAGTAGAEMRDPSFGWYNTIDKGIPDVPTPDINKGTIPLPLNLDMGPRSLWGGNFNRGYIQSWNFTMERKLPLDTLLSVGYVGTRTIRQLLDRNINVVGPGLGTDTRNLPLARLYGRTNAANMWDGIGYGSYNSMQVTVNKSFSKGLYLKGGYTWGRYMNMSEDDGWAGYAMWNWEPMIARNYAPSDQDRRHGFVMAWVYELPFGAGRHHALSGAADRILGGWKLSGVFNAYTGRPFNVSGSSQSLMCIGCTQTADQIAAVKKLDTERGPNKPYYDPMSFRDPLFSFSPANPVYRAGGMGRNVLYGPGFWRVDPAIYKDFRITERVKAEFRAEAMNFTNTPRWGNPAGGSASMRLNPDGSLAALNNFMSITSATTDRQFRFGTRLQF